MNLQGDCPGSPALAALATRSSRPRRSPAHTLAARCTPGATLWHEEEAAILITRATGRTDLHRPVSPLGLSHSNEPLPCPSPLLPLPRSRYLRQSGLASIPRAGRDSEKQDHLRRYLEAIPCAEKANLRVNRGTAVRRVCTYLYNIFFFLAGYALRVASRSHFIQGTLPPSCFSLYCYLSII